MQLSTDGKYIIKDCVKCREKDAEHYPSNRSTCKKCRNEHTKNFYRKQNEEFKIAQAKFLAEKKEQGLI